MYWPNINNIKHINHIKKFKERSVEHEKIIENSKNNQYLNIKDTYSPDDCRRSGRNMEYILPWDTCKPNRNWNDVNDTVNIYGAVVYEDT